MNNACEMYAVTRLIHRYDYDGAIEILDILQQQGTSFYNLVLSCQRSINFNFSEAKRMAGGKR